METLSMALKQDDNEELVLRLHIVSENLIP